MGTAFARRAMINRIPLDRAVEIAGFLAQHAWAESRHTPLPSDFSPRRYARLERADGHKAILMDADADQKTTSFVKIAALLLRLNISAPHIFAADPMRGLVLMEDLGDRNIGKMLDEGVGAKSLYLRATDVLVQLHQAFTKNEARSVELPIFDATVFALQADLFLDSFIPFSLNREATGDERATYRLAWKKALCAIDDLPQTLLLRDFMPDNLMDLSECGNGHRLGVLDFQDAGIGPIAYDLASLCDVVRRDGGGALLGDVIHYYHHHARPAVSLEALKSACHVLAAQRHIRILGIVTQFVQKTGRRQKLAYLPRIWTYLDPLLRDDTLKPLGEWLNAAPMRALSGRHNNI
jgi:aminoglycoside/choline kinase family phosphotransferase